MAKIEQHKVGQVYYQADLLVNGCDVEEHNGDCWSTFEEADAEGQCLARQYDPEWQKRNSESVVSYVRKFECLAVDEDGSCGHAVGSAVAR